MSDFSKIKEEFIKDKVQAHILSHDRLNPESPNCIWNEELKSWEEDEDYDDREIVDFKFTKFKTFKFDAFNDNTFDTHGLIKVYTDKFDPFYVSEYDQWGYADAEDMPFDYSLLEERSDLFETILMVSSELNVSVEITPEEVIIQTPFEEAESYRG